MANKDFDPTLAPPGFIAVQIIPMVGQHGSTLCKGCAFGLGKEHAAMCWKARCTPPDRPDERHAIFVQEVP